MSASAITWSGQQISFDFRNPEPACYRCVYPEQDDQDLSCNEAGIMSPVVGLIGLIGGSANYYRFNGRNRYRVVMF